MEFMELVSARRSVRDYSEKPVEEEKLSQILEAARLAPSWANRQCWSFVVVKDRSGIEKVFKACGIYNSWLRRAPVLVIGCGNPKQSGSRNGMDYYLVDMGISMEHLVLAAASMGLGTCWIGAFDENRIRDALGIPENVKVVALTPVGYPVDADDRSLGARMVKVLVRGGKRKPIDEIVHREKW